MTTTTKKLIIWTFFVWKCVTMRKEIRTTEAERRRRENELTRLSMGKWCTLPHLTQASVISYLMTFAAPTVLPTLEIDLVPILSNCFSAETELGNPQRSKERCCNKSAMLKSQRAHTQAVCMCKCLYGSTHWFVLCKHIL